MPQGENTVVIEWRIKDGESVEGRAFKLEAGLWSHSRDFHALTRANQALNSHVERGDGQLISIHMTHACCALCS